MGFRPRSAQRVGDPLSGDASGPATGKPFASAVIGVAQVVHIPEQERADLLCNALIAPLPQCPTSFRGVKLSRARQAMDCSHGTVTPELARIDIFTT